MPSHSVYVDTLCGSFRTWLAEHPQDRFGAHTYRPEQYGLTVTELEPVFTDYLPTFGIELEGQP